MAENYVIFNGVSSRDIGLVVERLPDFHRAKRMTKEYVIPGRSGKLIVDQGGYDTEKTTLKINCFGVERSVVYGWLRGEGWMISSDEPQFKAYVNAYARIKDDRFRCGGCYDTLSIDLQVQPYLRLVNEAPITLGDPAVFDGMGHDPSRPLIAITGRGNVEVLVNDSSVLIDGLDGTLYLDCEAGIAYTEADGKTIYAGDRVQIINGWPELEIESNRVNWTSGVSSVVIQPNWRWL